MAVRQQKGFSELRESVSSWHCQIPCCVGGLVRVRIEGQAAGYVSGAHGVTDARRWIRVGKAEASGGKVDRTGKDRMTGVGFGQQLRTRCLYNRKPRVESGASSSKTTSFWLRPWAE